MGSERRWIKPVLVGGAIAAVLGIALAVVLIFVVDLGPSPEEQAAEDEAAAQAAAQEAGDTCRQLTEGALTVIRRTYAQLQGDGYTRDDYGDQVADITYEVESIDYFDQPLCEEEVGIHLEETMEHHQDAEDSWNSNHELQAAWASAEASMEDAESGLDSIYSGSAALGGDATQ